MLTDGFAFRLLLATERDAAMQQMALEMAGECPGGRGQSWCWAAISQPRVAGELAPVARCRTRSTRAAYVPAPPCPVARVHKSFFTPGLLPSFRCTGSLRLAVEEDMPLRTWHQGAISGGRVCWVSCLLGLAHRPHVVCCLVALAM